MRPAYDALILGGGPAGLNAALVLGRARRRVLLCDDGRQRNSATEEMHGFVALDCSSTRELLSAGRRQLERYPTVELRKAEVTDAACLDGAFVATIDGESISARRAILATGVVDELPPIDGLERFWGRSAFSCPYCDGWEVRDQRIVIAGESTNLVGLAQELYQWSHALTICGLEASACGPEAKSWTAAAAVSTRSEAVVALTGAGGSLRSAVLAGGETLDCDALFLCAPLRQRSELAARIGCNISESGRIVVDQTRRTSVEGVYAAGDAVEHVHQVVMAAASGAAAAIYLNAALTEADASALAR